MLAAPRLDQRFTAQLPELAALLPGLSALGVSPSEPLPGHETHGEGIDHRL